MSATSRVGMPTQLYLNDFGQLVLDAFGEVAYWVGSSSRGPGWRDVDIRVILNDARYAAEGYGRPEDAHSNAKWVAQCKVWSAYGKQMTGLPIDFQIQQTSHANKEYGKPEHIRCPLFVVRDRPEQ